MVFFAVLPADNVIAVSVNECTNTMLLRYSSEIMRTKSVSRRRNYIFRRLKYKEGNSDLRENCGNMQEVELAERCAWLPTFPPPRYLPVRRP